MSWGRLSNVKSSESSDVKKKIWGWTKCLSIRWPVLNSLLPELQSTSSFSSGIRQRIKTGWVIFSDLILRSDYWCELNLVRWIVETFGDCVYSSTGSENQTLKPFDLRDSVLSIWSRSFGPLRLSNIPGKHTVLTNLVNVFLCYQPPEKSQCEFFLILSQKTQ